MIVSLNKHEWLYQWLKDRWYKDIYDYHTSVSPNRKTEMTRKFLGDFLEMKGYKSKVTSSGDLLISISEEEFTFLRLKYE